MKNVIKGVLKKIVYFNDFNFNLFKRLKKDKNKYISDVFLKSKYKKLLKLDLFKYSGERFYYNLYSGVKFVYRDFLVDNITISYKTLINKPLNDILDKHYDKKFAAFIREYFKGIKNVVSKSDSENKAFILKTVNNMFASKSLGFADALQRILLYNQLLWQTGHRLNGLGRLDLILDDYYKNSNLPKEETKSIIKDFLTTLHKDYYFKSNVLKGDTGQIIILGGLNPDGTYFCNDLTYLFIECVKELGLPDPKTLLRVASNIPNDLLMAAVDSIKTGCGSPLLSNDDVVISKIQEIGYSYDDSYNYVTSACWEPLIEGKSLEQNNISNINFMEPLNTVLANDVSYDSFEELVVAYLKCLDKDLLNMIDKLNDIKLSYDPLISTFIDNCIDSGKDISKGGAVYNNYGILSTAMGNVVDALLNIKILVFDSKKYTLKYLVDEKNKNFSNVELKKELKTTALKYGMDDEIVIELTNRIIDYTNNELKKYKNNFGGVFRFGLSSPSYIDSSTKTKASLDGRCDYEPFNVHISSSANVPYTEILNFASKLHYGKRNVNGNVCDLIVAPSFIDSNYDKFLSLLKVGISEGFFQIQFNVVDSKTLIAAKKNPNNHKNLIVRVWGFSAYFVELPENYQDLLIRRALTSEASC